MSFISAWVQAQNERREHREQKARAEARQQAALAIADWAVQYIKPVSNTLHDLFEEYRELTKP